METLYEKTLIALDEDNDFFEHDMIEEFGEPNSGSDRDYEQPDQWEKLLGPESSLTKCKTLCD